MPDLEQRVSTLEREMAALKARVDSGEEDARNIPDLIKTEFRLSNSQIARLSREFADLRGTVGGLSREFAELRDKVEVLPRVVAELVVESIAEREKKQS